MENKEILINEIEWLQGQLENVNSEFEFYENILNTVPLVIYVDNLEPLYLIWGNPQSRIFLNCDPELYYNDPEAIEKLTNKFDFDTVQVEISDNLIKKEENIGIVYRIHSEHKGLIWIFAMGAEFSTNKDGLMTEDVCMAIEITPYAQKNKELEDVIIAMRNEINELRLESLSDKEREVLNLVFQKYSIKQIAKKLKKSYHTVENQKRSIKKKLNVKKTTELMQFQ